MKHAQKKILIVEDNEAIRHMYRTKLEAEGFLVTTAGDGDSGYAAIESFQPDVVLLDIMMPGVTGIDFLTYVRRLSKNDRIKIIVLTNLDDPHLKHSLNEVVSDYIVKAETTPGAIVDRIRKLLK